jgi:hypothetical protein
MPAGRMGAVGSKPTATPGFATITDTFTRANSTTNIGTTDTGQVWSVQSGSWWGISSNRAYTANSMAYGSVVVESSVSDCTISVLLVARSDSGLCWRSTDNNNYWSFSSGFGTVNKRVAGTFTQVATFSAAAHGDTMSVTVSGNTHTIKKNGITVATFTDSFNSTATKHGLYANNYADPQWDNFQITVP